MAYTTINKSTDYFNNKLWTGDGSSSRNITGVGFQPDWVWGKCRNTTVSHALYDVVRGSSKLLSSNGASAEGTNAALNAFVSDGFTVNSDSYLNGNSNTYVAWNWKAGTAVSGQTTGSGTYKTYTGSVNTTSGFSIIKYTGNGTAGHTIPHRLGVAPKMIMVKSVNANEDWMVYNKNSGASNFLILNATAAAASGTQWNSTTPTSSVFSIGSNNNMNQNGNNFIAYCFANVQGYSQFAGYTGNNNTNGPFIYTGFKPAFIIIKKSSNAGNNWYMWDNKRNTSNLTNKYLNPDLSSAEGTANYGHIDILSNGFKTRSAANDEINQSGHTFIYMAFGQTLVGTNNTPNNAF